MADLALVWDQSLGMADMVLDAETDDLLGDEGLHTAVLMSLVLDRRAEPEDAVPGDEQDRRGWLFDELAEVEGDKQGSRRWLVTDRAVIRSQTPAQVAAYDREALEWLLEDGVAEAVDVSAEIENGGLVETADITRPRQPTERFRFAHVWVGEVARAV